MVTLTVRYNRHDYLQLDSLKDTRETLGIREYSIHTFGRGKRVKTQVVVTDERGQRWKGIIPNIVKKRLKISMHSTRRT